MKRILLDDNNLPIKMSVKWYIAFLLLLICQSGFSQQCVKSKKYQGYIFSSKEMYMNVDSLSVDEINTAEELLKQYIKNIKYKIRKNYKIKRKIRQYYAVNTPEGKILTIELLDKSIIRHHCRDFNYKDWCSALSNGYLLVCDGGCDVITVEINLTTKQIIRFRCNGDA